MLQADQTRLSGMFVIGSASRLELFDRQVASPPDQWMWTDPRHGGKRRLFVGKDMAAIFAEELVAPLAMQSHRDLVGHGPGGHEDRRLFAQPVGNPFLQFRHRWVDIDHVVAHRGRRHHAPHLDTGLGDGIAA